MLLVISFGILFLFAKSKHFVQSFYLSLLQVAESEKRKITKRCLVAIYFAKVVGQFVQTEIYWDNFYEIFHTILNGFLFPFATFS